VCLNEVLCRSGKRVEVYGNVYKFGGGLVKVDLFQKEFWESTLWGKGVGKRDRQKPKKKRGDNSFTV